MQVCVNRKSEEYFEFVANNVLFFFFYFLFMLTANRKFNELTEADQNIKKTLKSEAKKAAKNAKKV